MALVEATRRERVMHACMHAGVDYLATFIDNATFPVLGACNLDLSAEPRLDGKIQKWATFTLEGTNVAILGFANVDQAPEMQTITGNIGFFEPVRPPSAAAPRPAGSAVSAPVTHACM